MNFHQKANQNYNLFVIAKIIERFLREML